MKIDTPPFRLPGISNRIVIVGQTGSGKTQFGLWILSKARFDLIPYVVIDYKGDDLIASSRNIEEIGLNTVPKKPGLYVVRPHPDDNESGAVERWLMKIWAHENVGLFVDEGYMLPQKPSGGLTYILTQGRSKHIPVIALSQRPKWLSRFVFSEATFFAVFRLAHTEDYKTVQEYIPKDKVDIMAELPDFHSTYYDVEKRAVFRLKPVPDGETIMAAIDERLATPKRRL